MDAIMKILEQLEQSQLQAPERRIPERERIPEVVAAPVTPVEPVEVPVSAAPESGARWSRQRVLDALQLSVALGPPPGLEGL